MKSLWRSKRFRDNLYKWIFMYVGVMLVFTSVVTYSKYISRFPYEENTRIAKFDLQIDSILDTECSSDSSSGKVCDMGNISPLGDIDYYFKVDTHELEVQSLLVLNFLVNKEFQPTKISMSNDLTVLTADDHSGINNVEVVSCETSNCNQLKRVVNVGNDSIMYYKVTLHYNGVIADPNEPKLKEFTDVLKIDYSATQIK